MNKPYKFIINLTNEEMVKLRQLWQTNPNFRVRNRSQAILLSFERVSIDEIAKTCQVGRDAVSRWLRKWETAGEEGLRDEPKSGRKPRFTKEEEAQAVKVALEMPQSPARKLAESEQQTGKRASARMLKRMLKKNIVGNGSSGEKRRNTTRKSFGGQSGN